MEQMEFVGDATLVSTVHVRDEMPESEGEFQPDRQDECVELSAELDRVLQATESSAARMSVDALS
jgi:hypothetical protein